jgi:peptidoglycan/LPS O-acetylase OafA/YrhL
VKAPFSLYLDGLRLLAAVTVLLSHFAYERFTGGRWLVIRDYNLGSDAVVLFFVLSGLVIAFAAGTKDRAGGAFLFARATRLYSVALPAVLATLLMDRLGAALDPAAYDGWWHNPAPVAEQLWYGLTYSGEWLSKGFRLGSNGPWWSLSYEVAYYLIFAAAMFLAGALRIVAILCSACWRDRGCCCCCRSG